MTDTPRPPVSPDGRWWWDGQAWQPTAGPGLPGLAQSAAPPPGGRWERGLRLARASWDVLRSNPALGVSRRSPPAASSSTPSPSPCS